MRLKSGVNGCGRLGGGFAGLLALLAAAGACLPADEKFIACEPLADVETVLNEDHGIWASRGVSPRLVEAWRTGPHPLEDVLSVAADPLGRLAIADRGAGRVLLVDSAGYWHGAISRRGSGPGELQEPVAVSWTGYGELAVLDPGNSKVIILGESGGFHRELAVEPAFLGLMESAGHSGWAGVQPDGGVLLSVWGQSVPESPVPYARGLAILRLSAAGPPPDTLLGWVVPVIRDELGVKRTGPGWAVPLSAVGTDGVIVTGGYGGYDLRMHNASGRVVRQVCRKIPAPLMTPREREWWTGYSPGRLARLLRPSPLPDSVAPYGRILLGAQGRILVQRNRPPVDGRGAVVAGAVYDAFDTEGNYLGELRPPSEARLVAASGDRVWSFEADERGLTSIVSYQVVLD